MTTPRGPVLIEIDEARAAAPGPDAAPPVPDEDGRIHDGAAMTRLAGMAATPRNRLGRWFWGLLGALVLTFAGLAFWQTVAALLERSPLLAGAVTLLAGAFALVCLAIALREVSAFARLGRIDRLQRDALDAAAEGDLARARGVADALAALYAARPEMRARIAGLAAKLDTTFDTDATLALAETDLLRPLDAAASAQVEAAARQVATVTALVPLALADLVTALTANLRMIRAVAEIYGGRSGTLGTWRLTRSVLAHLVATGAVAVSDDLLHSILGGSVLSRVSRRFGEGVVNGALTARVGVAAIEVCRPLPFRAAPRPSVSGIVKNALTGLFPGQRDPEQEPR